MITRQKIGRRGEAIAIRWLRSQGKVMIARNYKTWQGEIDSIFWDGREVYFIEVKTRTTDNAGLASEGLSDIQLNKLYETVSDWLLWSGYKGAWRLLLLAITIKQKKAYISIYEL